MLRDRYRCQICGTRRRARDLEVDHIVEIARGGAALEYSNLQTVCRQCHKEKTRAFVVAGGARAPASTPDLNEHDEPPGAALEVGR
jgi:5-methylcytosine-specific restriction endonuclease McrA